MLGISEGVSGVFSQAGPLIPGNGLCRWPASWFLCPLVRTIPIFITTHLSLMLSGPLHD